MFDGIYIGTVISCSQNFKKSLSSRLFISGECEESTAKVIKYRNYRSIINKFSYIAYTILIERKKKKKK